MIYQRGHLARPLDAVLGSASRLSTMRALAGSRESLSGRQVAQRAGINHQAAALALKDLEKAGMVRRRAAARSIQWSLDRRRFLVDEVLLSLFEAEVRHADEIIGAIKSHLARKADAVIIVGEGARGVLASGEPLELFLLCELGRRRAMNDAARTLADDLLVRFGLLLKAIPLTRSQALSRLELIDGWQLLPTEGRPSVFTAPD